LPKPPTIEYNTPADGRFSLLAMSYELRAFSEGEDSLDRGESTPLALSLKPILSSTAFFERFKKNEEDVGLNMTAPFYFF